MRCARCDYPIESTQEFVTVGSVGYHGYCFQKLVETQRARAYGQWPNDDRPEEN